MLEAVNADESDKFEIQHRLLAWQTALLMNSTGNYKKQIKPEMLLGNDSEDKNEGNRLDREEKNRKLAELQSKFNTST